MEPCRALMEPYGTLMEPYGSPKRQRNNRNTRKNNGKTEKIIKKGLTNPLKYRLYSLKWTPGKPGSLGSQLDSQGKHLRALKGPQKPYKALRALIRHSRPYKALRCLIRWAYKGLKGLIRPLRFSPQNSLKLPF